jgi:hypothetical protein
MCAGAIVLVVCLPERLMHRYRQQQQLFCFVYKRAAWQLLLLAC